MTTPAYNEGRKSSIVLAMIGLAIVLFLICCGISRSDELPEGRNPKFDLIRRKAWEQFHVTMDANHTPKGVNWMDAGNRQDLLQKSVDAAIETAIAQAVRETKEAEKPKPRAPKPDIAPMSSAWYYTGGYGAEPRLVTVMKGPTEERQYLIYTTYTLRVYSSGDTYPRSRYESFQDVEKGAYRMVDEHTLYFAKPEAKAQSHRPIEPEKPIELPKELR